MNIFFLMCYSSSKLTVTSIVVKFFEICFSMQLFDVTKFSIKYISFDRVLWEIKAMCMFVIRKKKKKKDQANYLAFRSMFNVHNIPL